MTYHELHAKHGGGFEAGDIHAEGTRVYSSDGTEFALVVRRVGDYHGAAGFSSRVLVVWPDDETTRLNVKGLKFENGRWQIRS